MSDASAPLAVGNAPLSWGVFDGEDETNPPWGTVLDEIAEAGYDRLELGPIGFLPEDVDVLAPALEERGLALLAGFVYEDLHDPAQRQRVLATARRVCPIIASLGGRYLVVIDRMSAVRQATAGRSESAERLPNEQWTEMIETIESVAELATEFGLRPVLHPHAGSYIEFADEIDRAQTDLPASTIGLCIDTAHVVVAGMQAAELVDRYRDRVEYLHFKDVDSAALLRMREEGQTFDQALGTGLFCPLGEGMVEWVALRESLGRIGFAGAATVEQDPDPELDRRQFSGLAAARASISFLREIGLAAEAPVGRSTNDGE